MDRLQEIFDEIKEDLTWKVKETTDYCNYDDKEILTLAEAQLTAELYEEGLL